MDLVTLMAIFTVVIVAAAAGLLIGLHVAQDKMEKDAINNGHAQYNSKTKKFEWLNNEN